MAVGDVFIMDEKQGKNLTRIDNKANWEEANPILEIGEMGIEKDGMLRNIKIGDGVTPWNSLLYVFKSCPYEVGDILVTVNDTDPAVRWPGTTWEAFAPGRVLIGAGTGTDVNGTQMSFEVGSVGGEYSHQLTIGELPAHQHNYICAPLLFVDRDTTQNSVIQSNDKGTANQMTYKTTNTGGSQLHTNIQPYLTAHIWKRLT